MTAKEERAINLEIHRMNRTHNEMVVKNNALEYECSRLRAELKNETAKYVVNQNIFVQQCNAYKAAELEMINAMQQEQQKMHAVFKQEQQETITKLQQQMMQETLARRQTLLNEFNTAKQNLEANYTNRIDKNTQELLMAKKAMEVELDIEKTAYVKREKEQLAYFHDRIEEMKRNVEEEYNQKMELEKKQRIGIQHELEVDKKQRISIQRELEVEKTQRIGIQRELELEKPQRISIQRELEVEKTQRVNIETQLSQYLSVIQELNEKNRQMEREQSLVNKRIEDEINIITPQLIKTISYYNISVAVAANYANIQMINKLGLHGKRVLLYSHYSNRDEVESYNYLTLQKMECWFDYIIVLTNCPNKWNIQNPDYNKYHILWYNLKGDFRNYAIFIMQHLKTLLYIDKLCLINDSFVIVDILAYERCMKRLFDSNTNHDFMGITSSLENVYHLQSYFICFNSRAVPPAMNYFEIHGIPSSHNTTIGIYELGITKYLMNQGLTQNAIVSNTEMKFPLNTTYYKWSTVLQHTGIIKRQHLLKQYPSRFAMTDLNISLIANKFSENKHFINFLKYHSINFN